MSRIYVHVGPGLSGDEARAKARSEVGDIFPGEVIFSEELMSIPF